MSESTLRSAAAALLACLFATGHTLAGGPKPPAKQEAGVARCQAVSGVLLQRAQPGADWQPVEPDDPIRADALLVALPEARLLSVNGAVGVKMLTDIGKRGPFPVLESAVYCHRPSGDADLEVTFDRGIIVFTNLKKKGAAKVRVRVQGHTGALILNEPGTRVGMEIYGRQPPGAPHFEKDVKGQWTLKDVPVVDFFLVVAQGSAYVQSGEREWKLTAPPGLAVLHRSSTAEAAEVLRLEKLPDSFKALTPTEEKLQQELCACASRLANGPLDKGLASLLTSDSELKRRAAVVVLGALDKLPQLLDALGDPKHADVRDQAILVLRHWVGRAPGQAAKLYAEATRRGKVTVVQAKNRLHLLYGFTDEERKEAGTYELLLTYLQHKRIGIRELARWHLVRLVPEGKQIPFDAAAPPEERARAVVRWRALIPEGTLPPGLRPRPPGKK